MKTWFITGASRGIGLEIARAALEAGDQIVATARKPEQVEANLPCYGNRLLALPLDVTVPDSIQGAVEKAIQRFARIDVLVNNAGYGQLGPFEQLSIAAVERQFATNVFGVFAVTRAVLPILRAQRSGHILSLSSIAGLAGFGGSSETNREMRASYRCQCHALWELKRSAAWSLTLCRLRAMRLQRASMVSNCMPQTATCSISFSIPALMIGRIATPPPL